MSTYLLALIGAAKEGVVEAALAGNPVGLADAAQVYKDLSKERLEYLKKRKAS